MGGDRPMKVWRIECATEGREVYYVQADTEDEARAQWEEDDSMEPSVSEVLHVEIRSIEEADR